MLVHVHGEVRQRPRRMHLGVAGDVPPSRAGQRAVEMNRRKIDPEHVDVEVGVDVQLEIELRHQVTDGVEAEAALDAGDADVGPRPQRRAGLDGGRRDREVALQLDPDDADVEARADAIEWRGNVGRNLLEARVEAAGADQERRVIAELGAERKLPGDA